MEQPRARFDPEALLDRLSAKWPNWPRWAGFVGGALAGSLLHKKGFPLVLTYAVWLGLSLAGWWVSRQSQSASATEGEAGPAAAPPPPPSSASRPRRRGVEEVWREIDSLVGLAPVKQALREVAAVVQANRQRRKMGLPPLKQSLHMAFLGNPGTGKTTVARLVGELFAALGALPGGHLVELDRSGLVAGYVGQTALKVQEVARRAMGGVLFVDEAYSLVRQRGAEWDFGIEALDALVKIMEDYRNSICVILAGYTNEMQTLLRANPGLESRIAFTIEFPDYSPEELLAIARLEAQKQGFSLTGGAEDWLLEHFHFVQPRVAELGNGRYARKLVEGAIRRAAMAGRAAGELRAEDFLD